MRTTLTLDDDVASLLRSEARQSGMPFKQVVNHRLRLGLMVSQTKDRQPFSVTPRRLGLPNGLSYDNVADLLEALEGDAHR